MNNTLAIGDRFLPWKGAMWGDARNFLNGTRLLVLGEAHYCDPDRPELIGTCIPECTVEVVQTYAIDRPHRFFTGITQIVSGRPKWQMTQGEIEAVWSAISFANYVPVFVADGPRVRPTNEMFVSGAAPFSCLLQELDPQAIVVCGQDLWWWMRKGWFCSQPDDSDSCYIGNALAVRIVHPSAIGFSSIRTRPIIERLISTVSMHSPRPQS